jgi:hypothetical protein
MNKLLRNKIKAGAMFGLDARIALAIFGALSVISGAALYSAIKQSNVTKVITEMNEVGKAIEAYYLDVGEIPPRVSTDSSNDEFYRIRTANLVEDTNSLWKGPYIGDVASGASLVYTGYGSKLAVILRDDISWGSWNSGKCIAGNKCHIWIYFTGIKDRALVDAIDMEIDGEYNLSEGNFRYGYANDASQHRIYYKYMPIANPNN